MICANCGVEFTPKPRSRPDTRYCKTACRQLAYQKRRYRDDSVFRERRLARERGYYHAMNGFRYAKLRLRDRRNQALRRLARRSAGANVPEGKREG